MNKHVITTVVVAVLVGALGFFGGMKYQQSKTTTLSLGAAGGQRQFTGGNAAGRGGARANLPSGSDFLTGSILSMTDNSLTVQLMNGGSKLVVYSSSTPIAKSDTGSPADIQTGKSVTIVGTDNSDGTVTARNIQIRNAPPMAPGSPSPAPGQ